MSQNKFMNYIIIIMLIVLNLEFSISDSVCRIINNGPGSPACIYYCVYNKVL